MIFVVGCIQFIPGNNRNQSYFTTPDDQGSTDNAVRQMGAFIDKLDLQKLGCSGTFHICEDNNARGIKKIMADEPLKMITISR